ncbi:MAG TPA: glycosyltransferase [Gemmatimonadaceae bacterium]|nr:glycosyltransferase [Gemmatimonadaceae bacterium]
MLTHQLADRAPQSPAAPDIVCLSHLRWDFVFQRPHHLLSRAARRHRVFYVEEPVTGDGAPRLAMHATPEGIHVVVPHLPGDCTGAAADAALTALLDALLTSQGCRHYLLWYYTPMALGFTRHLRPLATIYDVMDELSLFRFAPPALLEREAELYARADVVFTGGRSLYEAKRHRHPNVHLFPSSVDARHFARARGVLPEPVDQQAVPRPRIGFFGVIDERMDTALVAAVADARPDWQLVLLGPVVKIAPADLPQRPNLHYLGGRPYAELPAYAAHWQVAMMPWARNEATRFISPTKTPEYLAAGLPVVSTGVTDVVRTYADQGLVRIADDAAGFVAAIEAALAEPAAARMAWLARADAFLARDSWDRTWARMRAELLAVLGGPDARPVVTWPVRERRGAPGVATAASPEAAP